MRPCIGSQRVAGWLLRPALIVATVLGITACQPVTVEPSPTPETVASTSPAPTQRPDVEVTTVAEKLDTPTSMAAFPDGTLLVAGISGVSKVDAQGEVTRFKLTPPGMESPGGILDVAVPRWFDATLRLYVCYRTTSDIRVVPFEANPELTGATAGPVLLSGIPVAQNGPNGCELAFGPDGNLYVGTADAGQPRAPQDLASLAGKILRIDPMTHQPPPDNPFIDRTDPNTQLVFSYGHREVTGIVWNPDTGTMYATDRGPDRDDEVNVIVADGNYGWNPASASTNSYSVDQVPMTDLALPNARPAAYSSGENSRGLGPATFIEGAEWGVLDGSLAVSNTVGPRLLFLPITGEVVGAPMSLETPNPVGPTVDVVHLPDGDLVVLSLGGSDSRILRVTVV